MDLTISYLSLTCPQKAAPFPHPGHNQGYVDLERASLIRKMFELYGTGNYSLRETTSHEFSFTGLLTCKRCGWAITAEVKKNKYIYYHCTGYKGNCGNTRITEEDLDKRFAELVRRVEVPSEIAEWIKEALIESHNDERTYHDTQIKSLKVQYKKLQTNCTFDSGKLYPIYNRPFDLLVKSKGNDDWLRGGNATKLELFLKMSKRI